MSDEKVKTFALHILEECVKEGLTIAEVRLVPQALRFAIEDQILKIEAHTKINL